MHAQTPGEWSWMKGDTVTLPPVFGIQGVPDVNNQPQTVYGASNWTDLQGNFWVYGGAKTNDCFADLWKFNQATFEWTWMHGPAIPNAVPVYGTQGVADPANTPGARGYGSATWVDLAGNLWLFGGYDSAKYVCNDLWKYDISTNMWTWMHGDSSGTSFGSYGVRGVPSPLNLPPSRSECTSNWTDNAGNLWMSGGFMWNNYHLNDLWKYDPITNEWTWMHGDSVVNTPPSYGTIGISDPANNPGARYSHSRWKDKNGNFWIFGGYDTSLSSFSDMWKYDLMTNEWTWMNGASGYDSPGIYGTKCVSSSTSFPRCRFENRACWTDKCGNFWMMGGLSFPIADRLTDLWMFNPDINIWTWINNDSATNQQATFGTLGISDPLNTPGGRMGPASWIDTSGTLWLYGGFYPFIGFLADIWCYIPDPACGGCSSLIPSSGFQAFDATVCPGTCIYFMNTSTLAISYQWQFPGGIPDTSTTTNPSSICYSNPGSYDVTLISFNANGSDTLTLLNYITVFAQPPAQSIIQSGDTLFANAGSSTYQWYFNGNIISGATNYFHVALESGDYNVVATDSNGCEVEAVINDVLVHTPLAVGYWPIAIYPNPVTSTIDIRGLENNSADEITIYSVIGEKVFSAVNCNLKIANFQLLPSGLYYIEITSDKKIYRTKFIKQ